MSTTRGGGGGSSIPASSRKIVQSLKEIVNCPEPEIYAMLKECNMDPNEAVNRLLSQDPFHEVKSKREKKKENKDGTETRTRGANNSSNRGGRGGPDRYVGRAGSTYYSSNESGASHNRPAYKKENGMQGNAGYSSSIPAVAGSSSNRRAPYNSESVTTENKVPSASVADSGSSLPQPGFQSAWSGVPGQVSMADIVKMGRPQTKAPGMPNQSQHRVPASSHREVSDNNGSEFTKGQNVEPQDEWPPIEQPSTVNVSSVLELPAESDSNLDQKIHIPVEEDVPVETHNSDHTQSVSVTSRHMQEDNDFSYQNTTSYQPERHAFEHKEAEDGVTSVASNLQQLSLEEDDEGEESEEENPPVIIPDHLQVHAPECSHLSFGSFRSGVTTSFSGPFESKSSEDNFEGTSSAPDAAAVAHTDTRNAEYYDAATVAHADTRNTEYYEDENLKAASTENLIHGSGPSAGDYETSSSVPQSEVLKQDTAEPAQGNQYSFSSSEPGQSYENQQSLTNPQMQNLAPFSNVMHGYTNSLPSTLLPSAAQTVREADLSYSPFPVTQSMQTKYHAGSSISMPNISMPEALRAAAGSISSPQPTQQTLPGANVATGAALPQQLAVHPYSQPTLPLGHFANMISYPFLPQSYTYMPSAFQQSFANNSTYNQSLAAMLPQYKSSVSVSSLPQSAAVASGYGFGSSANVPGQNFPLNTPAAPGGTTVGFDEVLNSQYKDNNHMMSLQQNENSAMWIQGAGSRTMSAVPANTYYSFPGQNQQPPGFRQNQQPSQHFGALGYPNYYHSQGGMSLEQQQNARDGSLGGPQGQQVKQTQQLWQNGY